VLIGLLAACEQVTSVGDLTLSTAELLILPQQVGTPAPSGGSLWVTNALGITKVITHPDPTLTSYLEIDIRAGALASLAGQTLGPDDSVFVAVSPRSGAYGFILTPADLDFTDAFRPSVTLFFARYGDFSVADGSATYSSRDAYAAALDLWEEIGIDRWRTAAESRSSGTDQVSASLETGGDFLVAAPR
jgi:hypothetical protein